MANKWRRLPYLVRLLWVLRSRDITLVISLYLISGILPICTVIALQHMVDHAVALVQGNGDLHITLLWLSALVIFSYLTWASHPIREWIGYNMLARFKAQAQERLLEKASCVSLQTFETPAFYDQLHRAHRGVDERLLATLESFFPIPSHFITCTGLLIYLGTASWWLPLVLLAGLIPGHLLERKFDKKRYELLRKHTASQRRMDYLGELMTRREEAAEIRLFALETHLLNRWQHLFFSLRKERLRLAYERIRAIMTGVLSDQLAYSFVLTSIVALIARGSLSVGIYVACMDAVVLFRDSVLMLFNGVRNMEDDLQYLGDLLDYLEMDEGDHAQAKPTTKRSESPARRKHEAKGSPLIPREKHEALLVHTPQKTGDVPEVCFEEMTFCYPGNDAPVLEGLNLTIHAGERIALVGENGAGKTTLAKLLLGLYRPTEGQIVIDGKSLDDLNLFAWRKRVGAVFQDYMRYQITARENIGFGNLDCLHNEAAIESAAAKSGADGVIAELSSNYETMLGRVYDETGQDLSVGQWQKLAIARAYLAVTKRRCDCFYWS